MDQRVSLGHPGRVVSRVNAVLKDHKANVVNQDQWVYQDHVVKLDNLDHLDQGVPQGWLVQLVGQDQVVHWDQEAHKEQQVTQ